jgi:hypothetical protein
MTYSAITSLLLFALKWTRRLELPEGMYYCWAPGTRSMMKYRMPYKGLEDNSIIHIYIYIYIHQLSVYLQLLCAGLCCGIYLLILYEEYCTLWCLYPAAVYRVLHLCHVDELEGTSLLQLTNCCQQLVDLKLENCSFGDAANLRTVMLSLI